MGIVKTIMFVCCFLITVVDSEAMKNTMTILRNQMLLNYDSNSAPVKDHSQYTTVLFAISAIHIDVNDHEQKMVFVSYAELMWNDEYLKWNQDEYNNITELYFDSNEIWHPEIALHNGVKGVVLNTKSVTVKSSYDGKASFVISFTAEVPCQLDLTFWPIDKHTCCMQFTSWSRHGELIILQAKDVHGPSSGMSFEHYEINNQWKVLGNSSSSTEVIYDSRRYNFIEFNVTVQRQAAAHATYVTQTTLALMLTVLVSYFLPLRHHLSRLLLHMTALSILIICNFALFLSLPSSGGGIPFVVRYFSGTIILTTLSLICNVALTTTLCSDGNNTQSGVKKKLVTFLGLANVSCNGRSPVISSREIGYSNLEEELRDMSENHAETTQGVTQSNQHYQPTVDSEATVNESVEIGFFRLINIVLFCMFAISYVVDYIILRSSISQ